MPSRPLFLLALLAATPAVAAPLDPLVAFAPLTLPTPPGATRSAGGMPGPAYWQNRADYSIQARIEPATHTLTATETITYTNNSPDALDALWVQLDQNIYRRDARAAAMPRYEKRAADEFTDGYKLGAISVEVDGRATTPQRIVSDTRLQLRLAGKLAHGAHARISITYIHRARRLGRPHRGDQHAARRHLRDCSVVPAHGGV